MHPSPFWQGSQVPPPQSLSVSRPFFTPSEQVGPPEVLVVVPPPRIRLEEGGFLESENDIAAAGKQNQRGQHVPVQSTHHEVTTFRAR
jgi:hypothetical protein